MLGPPKLRALDQPIRVSLEDLVPMDNFYRYLDAKLDLSFVREWVADCYAERGRPSIDPVVFFKLQLILFFEGLRSERKLMETVHLNLAHRWYLGYRLDEPLPDHSSLTRIRTRLGLLLFQRFFQHVVELCQQAGLVWGQELIVDATKVPANADYDSLIPRWYLRAKAHLEDLFAGETPAAGACAEPGVSAAEASATVADESPGAADALVRWPFPGTAAEEQRVADANQTTWRLLDQLRLDPERPATRGYQRKTDLRVSTTDPDAAPIQTGVKPTLGYRDHYVVDGGKARIILSAVVLPGDIIDNTPLPDLLWRVRFRWKIAPRRVVADARYGTTENIQLLEEAGIRAYMPVPNFDERTDCYPASRFSYDAAQDAYRCPEGHLLHRSTVKHTDGAEMYRPDAAICNACPVKAACTTSDHGRTLRRSLHADLIERVKGYHQTEAYKKAMRKRQVWVEPLFGEAKDWHGLRRFRLRGLWKVNSEGLLVAAGQNLKRWLTKTGWGRRHGPAGSLALSPSLPSCPAFACFS